MTFDSQLNVDVLVVGAGPTGCAAAMAFAQRGQKVLLIDAKPGAARRFAGEWMHPPAVVALRNLGVDTGKLASAKGHGFALYGSPEEEPVQLPYVRGTSLARVHHELVDELRDYARDYDGITYLDHHAFVRLITPADADELQVVVEDKKQKRQMLVTAKRLIGADGRSSRVAASIDEAPSSSPVSYMMGVELRDIELPHEGLGHVFFGGPGPALFYRVDDDIVRGCLDVPIDESTASRRPDAVFELFAPHLPDGLREAFRSSLTRATPWAATRFAPRGSFGAGNVWLAGDAAGHVHPITGMGMTFGILDAVEAASAENLHSYREAREAYVSELLTNVLYTVFRRHDESTTRVRKALLRMLKDNPAERRRTMEILMAEGGEGRSFARSFLLATGYSVADRVLAGGDPGNLPATYLQLASSVLKDARWLKWPLSAVLDDVTGYKPFRSDSSIESPLPPMKQLLSTGAQAALRVAQGAGEALRGGNKNLQSPIAAAAEQGTSSSASSDSSPPVSGVIAHAPASSAEQSSFESDWAFCKKSLVAVSRTFSQPIALLPQAQERALTVGYLLCRVADTIEDTHEIESSRRDELFTLFQRVLRGQEAPASLSAQMSGLNAPESELELAAGLSQVMRVFDSQSERSKQATLRWVSEMTDGMRLYSRRVETRTFNAMESLDDLERYCYFVAGTVGHLITDLFDEAIAQPGLESKLRPRAESFGLGLQMVNIVKDVTDDFERQVCYLPRELCRAEGFEPEALLLAENRDAAHRVAARVAQRAGEHLDNALEYTLNIPAEHSKLRLFCLLPLWMAAETLNEAHGHEGIFSRDQKVKISRAKVGAIVAECASLCSDDESLRQRFSALRGVRLAS